MTDTQITPEAILAYLESMRTAHGFLRVNASAIGHPSYGSKWAIWGPCEGDIYAGDSLPEVLARAVDAGNPREILRRKIEATRKELAQYEQQVRDLGGIDFTVNDGLPPSPNFADRAATEDHPK